ncbi:hypothetical protein ASPCADRAFT_128366 [Aspergillus carbonarius ITEM 5010]|uniref:Uncharacterized protein n=1 Tax=Aspergillus carbonarius (strain ITEM 5010) TaxID=602072 RepID=A0A1R3RUP5_ASPC5|nr:hypothetical protein ASPCADRAFT_128366 [Aspergillus carbonarius ITEM 5010]
MNIVLKLSLNINFLVSAHELSERRLACLLLFFLFRAGFLCIAHLNIAVGVRLLLYLLGFVRLREFCVIIVRLFLAVSHGSGILGVSHLNIILNDISLFHYGSGLIDLVLVGVSRSVHSHRSKHRTRLGLRNLLSTRKQQLVGFFVKPLDPLEDRDNTALRPCNDQVWALERSCYHRDEGVGRSGHSDLDERIGSPGGLL